jgi:hypothetical protein
MTWSSKGRPALILCLLLGACHPGKLQESQASPISASAGTGPIELGAFEMASITAAGVSVDLDVTAFAKGPLAKTDTDVLTGIVTHGPYVIGYGFGQGEALACCDPASEVFVNTTASGTGDYVFTDSFAGYGGYGDMKFGVTNGLVLAISGPSREDLVRATEGFMSDVRQTRPEVMRPAP